MDINVSHRVGVVLNITALEARQATQRVITRDKLRWNLDSLCEILVLVTSVELTI